MIDSKTVKMLKLKSLTMSACYEMYNKLSEEYGTPNSITEVLSWWRDQPEKLNEAWWVFNYYSKSMDENRQLRALVEDMLDQIAIEKEQKLIVEI